MSDQTTSSTHDRGPVAPTKPDVSAFGKRGERGRRLAAAQRGNGRADATDSAAGPSTTTDVSSDVPKRHQEGQTAPSVPEKSAGAGASGPVLAETATSVAPAEHLVSNKTPADTEKTEEAPRPASSISETPAESEQRDPSPPDGSPVDTPDERPKGPEDQAGVDETQADDDADDDAEEEFWVGKATKQSWVPDALAARFHRMQDSGKTAETIVLTAVKNCSDRLPELIKAARGPVHEDGLFPGLPVIERGSGRKKNDRRNSARIQYQVSPKFRPALERVAKQHRLKLSVLVRLALGDYFGIPVRIDRVK